MSRNQMKRFTRPKAEILEDSALIPAKNLIKPAPNRFTHQTIEPAPFFYDHYERDREPDGQFPEGTQVILLVDSDGEYCRVADNQGLYVEVLRTSIKKIDSAD